MPQWLRGRSEHRKPFKTSATRSKRPYNEAPPLITATPTPNPTPVPVAELHGHQGMMLNGFNMDQIKALGPETLRVEVIGTELWGTMQILKQTAQAGKKAIVLIDYEAHRGTQTDWNKNNVEHDKGNGQNDYQTGFVDAVGRIVQRIKDEGLSSSVVYEIWNEPNCWTTSTPQGGVPRYWGGYYLDPSIFANLLRKSYDKIKSIEPTAQVISGGILLFHDYATGVNNIYTKYGSDVHVAGKKYGGWATNNPYDAWGVHTYPSRLTSAHTIYQNISPTRSMLNYNGSSTKKIWDTEFGTQSGTTEVNRKTAADFLKYGFQGLKQYQASLNLGPTCWFSFYDFPGGSWGLIDPNGQMKPAGVAYTQYANY